MSSKPQKLNAAARLERLLKAKKGVIPYNENCADKEHPEINWSVYGAVETNELFVRVTNGRTTFVEAIESGLLYPPMADRIFGMDVDDSEAADALSNRMWKKYRSRLLKP